MLDHVAQLLRIPGAKLLFGGRPLTGHTIPSVYGAIEPTAVFVPLEEAMKAEHWGHVTTELFGPFQVVTQYGDGQVQLMLDALERMSHHLTAAVVSNDINL
ncbi:aldehyde dehydrogenase, partial [Haematococcus lacustris]